MRINRIIMEFKGEEIKQANTGDKGINRIIMEFKGGRNKSCYWF